MDVYWQLSDFDINTRQQGIEKLVDSLKTSSSNDDDKNSQSSPFDYTVSRLIKGLVSNRQCARIGYAATLGTLACLSESDADLQVPSTEILLSSVQNKLTTKKETGVEDAKNVRIGRVLSYVALAYAQKDRDLSSLLPKIVPDLLVIRTQETRRRLRTFIDATLIQLAKWSGRKLFKKEILSRIEDLLPTNWQLADDGTKSIYLLVSLANLYPKLFDQEYFRAHWNRDALSLGRTEDEKETIKKCLQSFGNELHLLQQLSQELLGYSIRTQQFSSFWPILVKELSNIGLDSNKGHILFDMIIFCFQEHQNEESILNTILDSDRLFFGQILDLLSPSGRKNHQEASVELAKETIDKLAHMITNRPINERLHMFDKLLNCADKNYAALQPIGHAVAETLAVEELTDYVKHVMNLFCEASKEDEGSLDRRRHFLLELVSNVFDCASFDLKVESCSALFENILATCVLSGYFKLNGNHIPEQLREFLHGNIELSDVTREHAEDIVYKLVSYEFHKNQHEHSLNVFRKATKWCKSSKHYAPLFNNAEEIKTYLSENSERLFEIIQKSMIQTLPDEKLRSSFQQVFVLSLYDLFVDFNRARQYLDDLMTCVENAHAQLVSKKKPRGESSWIEVFVDILLSMYTKKQHLIRSIIKKIYHQIAPHVNEKALKLMLQTLAPDNESDDDDDEEEEEEEEDDDDVSESEEESGEDDEIEENGDVNESLRQAVEKALGDAAVKDDEEDDIEMDDEAMLRLDPLIADAFRSQMKKSSNVKIINEKLHHQFRVLDLIESVIKKDERARFVLISIRPLIETLTGLPSAPAYKPMVERIDSILSHLSNRKLGHSDMPTTDECLDLFRYLTSLAGTRTKLTTETLSKVSMFVIKLSLHVAKAEERLPGVEETILTTYEAGFLRFLQPNPPKEKPSKKKKGAEEDSEPIPHQPVIHPIIIKEFFLRFPDYGTRLMLLMVQTALKDSVNWKKRNVVCGTLNNFFNKKQVVHVDTKLLDSTINLLVTMCNDSKGSKMESLHVVTVLTQKLLLIRDPPISEKQASSLLEAVSCAIKAKPIASSKQRGQLINLLQSFKKRFQLSIDAEIMSLLTLKRKALDTPVVQPKKPKATNVTLSNGHSLEPKVPVTDCRQMPFRGISASD